MSTQIGASSHFPAQKKPGKFLRGSHHAIIIYDDTMMQLQNQKDVAEMLAQDFAVLYVFVSWSEYARRGAKLAEEAEAEFTKKSLGTPVSWWFGDFSSIETPTAPLVHQWLTQQEQRKALHLFPNVATGNGSVVWINRGEIVSFAPSAIRLGLDGLLQRTRELLQRGDVT